MKRFAAMLLCVAMLMAGVVAQAENGYEYTKNKLNDTETFKGLQQSYWYGDFENTDKSLILAFYYKDKSIVLMGDDENGKGKKIYWNTADLQSFLFAQAYCLLTYDEFSKKVDEGYTFSIWIVEDALQPKVVGSKTVYVEVEPEVIDSKEAAESYLENH